MKEGSQLLFTSAPCGLKTKYLAPAQERKKNIEKAKKEKRKGKKAI